MIHLIVAFASILLVEGFVLDGLEDVIQHQISRRQHGALLVR